MSEKCKLVRKHEYKNPVGKVLIPCRLFGGEICFECCHRIEQTIDNVFGLVSQSVITPQEIVDSPHLVIGQLDEERKKYAEKILGVTGDWSKVKNTCTTCRSTPIDSPIIGSIEQAKVGHPGLQPIKRG